MSKQDKQTKHQPEPVYANANADAQNARENEIVKASVYGIVGNMLLVVFKMIIGFVSNSIAIILDGVNNATDAMSSIVTIVGTKLAGRKPDSKHPFGYGRLEYLTSVVIAVIILAAGVVSLRESIVKIIDPGTPTYSDITIAVIVVAIIAKIFIGIMFKRFGTRTDCEALIASGVDSNYDAVLSAGTLVVAFAQNIWNLNIDGIVGVVISLVVIKAGVEVLRDAVNPIIGLPENKKYFEEIEACAEKFPEVKGVYDIVLTDFGPREIIGSAFVEIPDNLNACQIHVLTRKIADEIKAQTGIDMAIGIYAEHLTGKFADMHQRLVELVSAEPAIMQTHGFFVDEDTKTCYFDLMIDFKSDGEALKKQIIKQLDKDYPGYTYDVQLDFDYAL